MGGGVQGRAGFGVRGCWGGQASRNPHPCTIAGARETGHHPSQPPHQSCGPAFSLATQPTSVVDGQQDSHGQDGHGRKERHAKADDARRDLHAMRLEGEGGGRNWAKGSPALCASCHAWLHHAARDSSPAPPAPTPSTSPHVPSTQGPTSASRPALRTSSSSEMVKTGTSQDQMRWCPVSFMRGGLRVTWGES